MGCFNRMGFYSNIPLTDGMKCVLFICGVNVKDVHEQSPIDRIIPIAPALIGTYNDYGIIENIERDSNVIRIEEFFEDSVDVIIKNIDNYNAGRHSDDEHSFVTKWTKQIISTFSNEYCKDMRLLIILENYEVYQEIISTMNKPLYEITHDYDLGPKIGDYWLQELGFNILENENNKKLKDNRIPHTYKHPNNEEYYVTSNGWGCPHIKNINDLSFEKIIYNDLQEFIKQWHKLTGICLELNEYNKNVSYIDLAWDKEIEKLKYIEYYSEVIPKSFNIKQMLTNDSYLNLKLAIYALKDEDEHIENALYDILNFNLFNDIPAFSKTSDILHFLGIYRDYDYVKDEFKKSICDFIKLYRAFTYLHLSFTESGYGGQMNNWKKHKQIHEKIMNICDSNILEDEDEEDDE